MTISKNYGTALKFFEEKTYIERREHPSHHDLPNFPVVGKTVKYRILILQSL